MHYKYIQNASWLHKNNTRRALPPSLPPPPASGFRSTPEDAGAPQPQTRRLPMLLLPNTSKLWVHATPRTPLTAPERPRSPGSHAPPRRQARPRLNAPGHARSPPRHGRDPAARVVKNPPLAAAPRGASAGTAATGTAPPAAPAAAAAAAPTAGLERQAGCPAYALGDAVAHREHRAGPAGRVAAAAAAPPAAPAVHTVDGGRSPEDVRGSPVAGGEAAAEAAVSRPEVCVRQGYDLFLVLFSVAALFSVGVAA